MNLSRLFIIFLKKKLKIIMPIFLIEKTQNSKKKDLVHL
jgi:hypothetical protein